MKKFAVMILSIIVISLIVSFFIQTVSAASTNFFSNNVSDYESLSPIPIPGTTGKLPTDDSFPIYLKGMYKIGIGACFVLGVIMFTYAGIEYIVSESFSAKGDAKKNITNALLGLGIALISFLLLQTINPNLVNFKSIDVTQK